MVKLIMRFILAAAPLLAGAFTIHAAAEPGIIKGADEFEFVYRVKLPEITGSARIWIPLAKTDSFQTVTVEKLNIPIHPTRVGSPPSSIGLDFTNGSHSATASNRRIVIQTFSAGASTTRLTNTRGIPNFVKLPCARLSQVSPGPCF
jgi:hypothetical protein